MKESANDGMTVVLSSSDSEELLDVADCIYIFYEGRVHAVLRGAEKTPEKLVAAMMGMMTTAAADLHTGSEGGMAQ